MSHICDPPYSFFSHMWMDATYTFSAYEYFESIQCIVAEKFDAYAIILRAIFWSTNIVAPSLALKRRREEKCEPGGGRGRWKERG